MAGLRAVDEAILQRDAKAAPQEALSFRPPDNSPFRRHFTRGFLLCLYVYSTRFAWECQCPFCTNPPGVSLCRLRDACSGGGPVHRKTRAGTGGRARWVRFSLRQGRGAESLSAHRQRGGRIAYPLYAVDSTAFSRAVEPPVLFSCADEKKPRFFRVPATDRAFPCAVGPTAFFSYAGGRPYGKTPRGRTLLRRGAFFAGSDLLRLFAEQPSDQRAQQARRTEAVNFQKNQPLPFYVISKRA